MATYLTTSEAAKRLQLSDSLVRRLCRQGRLGTRIGRNWAITPRDVQRYLDAPYRKRGPVRKD